MTFWSVKRCSAIGRRSVKPLNSAITTEKTHDPFLSPWLNWCVHSLWGVLLMALASRTASNRAKYATSYDAPPSSNSGKWRFIRMPYQKKATMLVVTVAGRGASQSICAYDMHMNVYAYQVFKSCWFLIVWCSTDATYHKIRDTLGINCTAQIRIAIELQKWD